MKLCRLSNVSDLTIAATCAISRSLPRMAAHAGYPEFRGVVRVSGGAGSAWFPARARDPHLVPVRLIKNSRSVRARILLVNRRKAALVGCRESQLPTVTSELGLAGLSDRLMHHGLAYLASRNGHWVVTGSSGSACDRGPTLRTSRTSGYPDIARMFETCGLGAQTAMEEM